MTHLQPLVVHQSDLQSFNYCPKRAWFDRQPATVRRQLSRTAYGTVMHAALQVFELALAEGETIDVALQRALAFFLHYWHPLNIGSLTDPIPPDGWMVNDSFGSLKRAGENALKQYATMRDGDPHEVLALEYGFHVPMRDEDGQTVTFNGREIWLAGEIDKLAVRWHKTHPYLAIDDFKTGKPKYGLRYNVQGTVYAYASLQPEFWTGGQAELTRLGGRSVLYEARGFGDRAAVTAARFPSSVARGFRWINLKGDLRQMDGGFRAEGDYARMREAVLALVAMDEANIHPLRLDGETCEWCPYRSVCGGGVHPDDGVPTR